MTEAYPTVLQTIIGEFRNISPEITSAFVFKKDGEILASTEPITEDQAKKLGSAYDGIANQAEVIGGVETFTIYGVGSQLINVVSVGDCYLATVCSREADEKMVKALTCVIVPAVVKLLNQISCASPNDQLFDAAKPEVKQGEETFQPSEEPTPVEPALNVPSVASEMILPKPPANQFMVQKIAGLLVAPDTVRVNFDVVTKWHDLYGDKEITQVNVETLEGRAVICKFKPMKGPDDNAKGIIQIPERILRILRAGEGKLVIVKPVILTSRE